MFYRDEMRRPPTTLVEERCRSALQRVQGMPFRWSLNPYGGCVHRCTFCYVRAFEERADRPSDDRYGRTVRVKVNVAEVLRAELSRRSWRRELVSVGSATDPYQPAEGRHRLTRRCLEAFRDFSTPISLITRGPLVVRDIDVLAALSARAEATVIVSVPCVDEEVVRRTEPGTAPPRQRLRALERLVAAGIHAGVNLAPILPGISDDEAHLTAAIRAAREAGATFLWAGVLHLKPGTREHFLDALGRDWPELLPHYRRLYTDRSYLAARDSVPIVERATALRRAHGIGDRRELRLEPPPEPRQLALAIP